MKIQYDCFSVTDFDLIKKSKVLKRNILNKKLLRNLKQEQLLLQFFFYKYVCLRSVFLNKKELNTF